MTLTPGPFRRPPASFVADPRIIDWIMADEANPLNRIVRLIPAGSRVLDIGAGNGILARLLAAQDKQIVIDAIEPDTTAIELARPFYRTLYPFMLDAYLESDDAATACYDYIVLADVIEHIPDPLPVLRSIGRLLAPGGKICISTPNVAFMSIRVGLLHGRFDYVDSGILERTHLRFFTRTTLELLIRASGLNMSASHFMKRNPLYTEVSLLDYWLSPFLLQRLLSDKLALVYQFLVVLSKDASGLAPHEEHGYSGEWLQISYPVAKAKRYLRKFLRGKGRGK